MKPIILLTGAKGQVGRELTRLLPRLGELTAHDRQSMDLAKPREIRRVIRTVRPALIVNAAAYTAVDQAESEPDLARAINAEAPAVMAEEAQRIGASLVHYSTDYVFEGRKTAPYDEDDPQNPQNVYGKTKLAGERAIEQSGAGHLIFRTAWVYAREGRNFLLTILRLATQRRELRIVCDQIGAPTWSAEIALATVRILALDRCCGSDLRIRPAVSGTYHMTAAGQTSWFEFAKAILDERKRVVSLPSWLATASNGLPLMVQEVLPIPSAEYPMPARRPAYSVLSNARLARTFGVELPGWRAQLHALFSENMPESPQP